MRVAAVGKAVEVLAGVRPSECRDAPAAAELYTRSRPKLLVAAISSLVEGPFVNNALIELARRDGVPVICLQDFWANHRHPSNKKMLPYYAAACVIDEFAAKLWREDGFSGAIHVTGNPAFDRFARVDVGRERARLRREFGLPSDRRVVVYLGEGTRGRTEAADRKTFAFVAEALRRMAGEVTLIARPHPRAANTDYYRELSAGIDTLDTSAIAFSEGVLPMADVAVSMLSTGLVHACLLRIPAVSVLLPNAGRLLLRDLGIGDFPPNTTGATLSIYRRDAAELIALINRVFTEAYFRAEVQRRQETNFRTGDQAAERVATVVAGFLEGNEPR